MLYLNMDNSLHDCTEIQSGDLNDSEMVQDYKKMSRKLSQTNIKVRSVQRQFRQKLECPIDCFWHFVLTLVLIQECLALL